MRLDDRAMTILTGLVLAVVVGTIAQQSPRILDLFSNKPTAVLVDDFFLVRTGVPQELDLLDNDQIANIDGELVIAGRPRCGRVSFSGSKAMFFADAQCDGNVVFSYCVTGINDCKPAAVSLNVRANSDDVRMVEATPAPPVPTPNAETTPEPTLQNAVQTAVQPTRPVMPVSTDANADVSVFVASVDTSADVTGLQAQMPRAQSGLDPAKIAQVARIAATTHDRAGAQFRPRKLDLEVAALSRSNSTPSGVARFLGRTLPGATLTPNAATTPSDSGLTPLAIGNRQTALRRDNCQISMGLQLADFAEVWVNLNSNCNAGEVVKLAHADTGFLIPLDGSGSARVRVPALKSRADFVAVFPGHDAPIMDQISVPDLLGMTRSLVSLDAKTMLDLSAREYDQTTGRDRVLVVDQGASAPGIGKGATGFLRAYSGTNGQRHFVYSRLASPDNMMRITRLQLVGDRDRACNMTARIATKLAEPAHQPGEVVHYRLPNCDGQGRYESHLRDIRVMPRDV